MAAMDKITDDNGDAEHDVDDDDNDLDKPHSLPSKWTKGVADPNLDSRVNIYSLNGFGEPVFTGGMYHRDEIRTLERTVKDYCASKNVTVTFLCGGDDHIVHNKAVRGAWQEIAQCLPHRTVISVYRRALRQFHGLTRGAWSKEEVASLFHLVDLHGPRWKLIQGKLNRNATDCRVKFVESNERFERGKWSTENVELLLQSARKALKIPRNDMDVREVNKWTLENKARIPWTAISYEVKRSRQDCYFKWKQMTKRSNQKAVQLGLEPVPMARETLKFDVRSEYYKWKAEQDPKYRQKYAEEFIMPQLQKEGGIPDNQKKEDNQLLDFIIESKATRPSDVSWHTFVQRGGNASRDRWEELVDNYARDDDMDLPLWKLAKVVKVTMETSPLKETREKNQSNIEPPIHKNELKPKKERRRKKNKKAELQAPDVSIQQLEQAIKKIVENAKGGTTVKEVRKLLEMNIGVDLSTHKDTVKRLIKEMLYAV